MSAGPLAADAPGLYLHVPFCARACPYCDFDFEVRGAAGLAVAVAAWLDGLEAERRARAVTGEAVVAAFDTIYLGGGTPSVVPLDQLVQLWAWLRTSLGVELGASRETTIELNPEHASPARLDLLVELGFDRVSLGVQSLEPEGLAQLGRVHDPELALRSVVDSVARGLRTSADLIVGWPGHAPAQLERELDALLGAGVDHLSIYALTIEAGTPWPKLVRRGLRILPDEERQADLLALAEDRLLAAGLIHYEVASYARPGAEAIHNSKYWTWAEVVGLGPSAASVRHRGGAVERRVNARGLQAWLDGAEPERERLAGERAAAEALWLGTRRLAGLDVGVFLDRFEVDRAWLEARVAGQVALGNLRWSDEGGRLAVAPRRWLWHDSIAEALL